MKMRKLLAAAVSATMAVTSMATAASAAEASFVMGISDGEIAFENVTLATGLLGEQFDLSSENAIVDTLGVSDDSLILKAATSGAFLKEDTKIEITGLELKVTGYLTGKGTTQTTDTYKFSGMWGGTDNWELKVAEKSSYSGAFVPSAYSAITKLELVGSFKLKTDVKKAYADNMWGIWLGSDIADKPYEVAWKNFPENTANGNKITAEIQNLLFNSTTTYGWLNASSQKINTTDPYIRVTDGLYWDKDAADGKGAWAYNKETKDKVLRRQEIWALSLADSWSADSAVTGGANNGEIKDTDQSYGDDNLGDAPKQFAGLASQVGDFFNKQTNGKITFKFKTVAAAGDVDWSNGGIPSTQVGIKNFLGDATANDFALFVNYDQTGSLQAVTSIDADAGTVEFDISNILDDLGGQTKGVVDNLYYGLAKGVNYKDDPYAGIEGLVVESVTLSYDEDADVEADIEDDAEVEDDADVEIEEDDDVEIEDDADDAVEEDDADTAGDVVVEDEDDDANPGTGVALAVVPAMVAAAAVVLSKKRK